MKVKIALYKELAYNYDHIRILKDEDDAEYWEEDETEARLSEFAEVELLMLPKEFAVKQEIAFIDSAIVANKAKAEVTNTELQAKKQKLLAITHEE